MNQSAARFTKRYTLEQIEAVMRSVITEGRAVTDTVKMAHAGGLGIPAFDLDRGYAYELVAKHREAYEASNTNTLADSIDAAIARLAAKALTLASKTERNPKATAEDIKRAVATLKAAREALARPETKPTTPTNAQASEVTSPDVLGSLLTNMTNGARDPVRSRAR